MIANRQYNTDAEITPVRAKEASADEVSRVNNATRRLVERK